MQYRISAEIEWQLSVGQAILPADTLSSVSRRRLKAGGGQDWIGCPTELV
jgi:hypothetical protein